MKATSDLFDLIKSLSKTEKTHFKKVASMHTIGAENSYVRLFDIIEKSEEYDEEKIIAKYAKGKNLSNFSVSKNYLYNLILRSLRLYHAKDKAYFFLKETLSNIEILNEKELYSQCIRLIEKGKEVARKYEYHTTLLELLGWEIEIKSSYQAFRNYDEKSLMALFDEIHKTAEAHSNKYIYLETTSKIFLKRKKAGFIRTKSELKYFNTNSPYFKKKELALSSQSIAYFHLWRIAYLFGSGKLEEAYEESSQLIQMMESRPVFLEEKTRSYITALGNHIQIAVRLNKYGEFLNAIKRLNEIQLKSEIAKGWVFMNISTIEFQAYIRTGRFDLGKKQLPQVEKLMPLYLNKNSNKDDELTLYYSLFYTCFGGEDYLKANFYLNKIINDTKANIRSDLYAYSRIMQVILCYEKGEIELAQQLASSTVRFLRKKKRLYPFESTILTFLQKKVFKTENENTKKNLFQELYSQIESLLQDPIERKVLDYFDFISWINSKIKNISFAQQVKEIQKQ